MCVSPPDVTVVVNEPENDEITNMGWMELGFKAGVARNIYVEGPVSGRWLSSRGGGVVNGGGGGLGFRFSSTMKLEKRSPRNIN